MTVTIAEYDSTEWTAPTLPDDLPPHLVEQAQRVRRRKIAEGGGGFYASHVQMPAGQVTVPHSHDHGELVVIIDGSLTFDGGHGPVDLGPLDAVTIDAGQVYGFTVGPDGVHFLLIRAGRAVSTLSD